MSTFRSIRRIALTCTKGSAIHGCSWSRIVTGVNSSGKSCVLDDGNAIAVLHLNGDPEKDANSSEIHLYVVYRRSADCTLRWIAAT